MVKDTSLCGLGQSAPKPVLSTLRHFRSDYLALVPAEATP
jgi:bidirectional [NiFe] hydrogenase diaphorase subunit